MDKLLYDKLEERDRAGSERLLRATRPGFLHDLFGLEYGDMLYRIEGDILTLLRVSQPRLQCPGRTLFTLLL